MIPQLTFGDPWLLLALIVPAVAAVAVWYAIRRRGEAARLFAGPRALQGGRGVRLTTLASAVAVTALLFAVLAAARPQWGEGDASVPQRGVDLVIALDVSRSMQAQDVSPDRATAAAEGLRELLTHMTGSRVGLVVFGDSAFARAPLTTDLNVVTSLIARSQGEASLVEGGTNFRAALAESFRVLDVEDPARTRVILFVSDGEDFDSGFEEAVDFAARRGIRISTVLVGSGEPVTLPGAGGEDVTVADPATLRAMADQTQGTFRPVETIPGFAVDFRRLQQTTFEETPSFQPEERFAWFAGAALVLLLALALVGEGSTRLPRLHRGVISTGVMALLVGVIAGCGTAAWRDVERGNEAFAAGLPDQALAAYEQALESMPDHAAVLYNAANALHMMGLYGESEARAEEARVLALDAEDGETAVQALFTAGNSAFLRDDYERAREAYQAALRIDPDDRDVKANLELVLRILEPPAPEPDPAEEPATGDEPGDGDGEGEGTGDGDPEGTGDGDPSEGDDPSGDPSGPGGAAPGDPSGTPGQDLAPGGAGTPVEPETLDDVRQALAEALGELGPDITEADALRLLDLARRANELQPLPQRPSPGGGPPPR